MKVSVIVPAYKRPELLMNCLNSLMKQSRRPDCIYVTAQNSDISVIKAVNKWQKKYNKEIHSKLIIVYKPGQSHAMNQAIKRIKKGIVCFIDDDAEAEDDWIEKVEKRYKNENVGGVGGFVNQHSEGSIDTGKSNIVGKVTWYGKVIGFHHYKITQVQDVDFFKGCNMSFRIECLPYSDENLTYEQFYDEVDVGLTAKERGCKLIFDPSIMVTHYDSPQFYIAKRRELKPKRIWSHNYNYIYVMMKHFKSVRILVIIVYSFLFMRSTYSGVFSFLISKTLTGRPSLSILWASLHGKISGINKYLQWRKQNI